MEHLQQPSKENWHLAKLEILTLYGGDGHTVVVTFQPNDENSVEAPISLKFKRPDYPRAMELAKFYQERYSKD